MPFVLAFGGGVAAGVWISGKAADLASVAKWAAIAGGVAGSLFIAAKAAKVI